MPVEADSVTLRTAAVATAASAALPPAPQDGQPSLRGQRIASAATMPRRATTIERREWKSKDMGFMGKRLSVESETMCADDTAITSTFFSGK